MFDEHCALLSSNFRLVQDQLKRQSTLPGKTIAPALCFLVGQKRKSPHRLVLSGCLGVLVLLFLAAPALSADVTLAWDANSEPDLEGYGVYFRKGTPGPPYDLAGNLALADLINDDAPLFVVSGLEKGFKYYFAVTAYDTAGNESTFSSAVCADVGDTITPCSAAPPGGGSVSGGGGSGGGGGGGGCFIETASDHQNKPFVVMVTLSFLVMISFIRFYFVFSFGRGIYAGDR
jgi:hypothetical protein